MIKAKVGLPSGEVARQHRPAPRDPRLQSRQLSYFEEQYDNVGEAGAADISRRTPLPNNQAEPSMEAAVIDLAIGIRHWGLWVANRASRGRRFTIRRAHLLAAARRGEHQEAAEAGRFVR